MAYYNYFDIEEVKYNFYKIYSGFCEDLIKILDSLRDDLNELCQQTMYEPLIMHVNKMMSSFTYDLSEESSKQFEEWDNEEFDYDYNVSYDDEQELKNSVRDAFDEFWKANTFDTSIEIDIETPDITEYKLEELNELYKECVSDIEDRLDDTIKLVGYSREDYAIYGVLFAALRSISGPVLGFFGNLDNASRLILKAVDDTEIEEQMNSGSVDFEDDIKDDWTLDDICKYLEPVAKLMGYTEADSEREKACSKKLDSSDIKDASDLFDFE